MDATKLTLISGIVIMSVKLMATGKYFTGYTVQNDSIYGWIATSEGIIKSLEEWAKDDIGLIKKYRDFLEELLLGD